MQLVTIGRAENCNVRMSDPLVSNVHCQILRDDNGEYRLVDWRSQTQQVRYHQDRKYPHSVADLFPSV